MFLLTFASSLPQKFIMKKMKVDMSNSQITSNQWRNQVFVKIAICLILIGFAFRFYFSSSIQISGFIDGDDDGKLPSPQLLVVANFTLSDQSPVNNNRTHEGSTECDVFTGEWIRDATGPRYTNHTCNTIEPHQNCMKNGRPDSDYLYWRWSPTDCNLPPFDPEIFLNFMKNKSMAFIGDSISRNHVQSLLCILSQIEEADEVYHDEEYRSKKWFFKSHNFTLSVIWSPFLTKANIYEDNDGHSMGPIELHLDELDLIWANQFNDYNHIMIAGGKWFLKTAIYYENATIIGCHNCKNENISEIEFEYAYRKSLRTVFDFFTKSNRKVNVLFRSTTPDHFENGEWNTGGYCNRTGPFKDGEIDMRDIDTIMRDVELEEFENAKHVINGSGLRLFDTTRLSLLRPDGHPGPYRVFHPFDGKETDLKVQNDCLHWCLPGPIDWWNDIMMNLLLNG
ncbi:protein trichome birefringence-like 26 [Lactuca sativa]|uniref:Trichome birefringence-like N-terminal domain-containing protein n=1 Tax=Lactuca sativa TaxID=4236 RepID=A0A9R1W2J4_LACSA|nr:protein trichome birefringence-like 26 [Lactuca sativa]KAJ0214778.1 hypothetical protein LSAT_V11C400170360 [Lactuca sativa]